MNLDVVVIGHFLKEKIIFPDGKEIGLVRGSPAAYSSVASALSPLLIEKTGGVRNERFPAYNRVIQRIRAKSRISTKWEKE